MHFDDRGTQENQTQRQHLSIFFIKDIIQWLRYIFIKLKNTRPPDLSGCEFTGLTLKSLAPGLRSSGYFEPCFLIFLFQTPSLYFWLTLFWSSFDITLLFSCSLPFPKFALNECIQQTEVYEYAQLLANKHYTLPNYQPYKFIYATRLADHGFTRQVLPSLAHGPIS